MMFWKVSCLYAHIYASSWYHSTNITTKGWEKRKPTHAIHSPSSRINVRHLRRTWTKADKFFKGTEKHLSLQNLLICSSPGFLEKLSSLCQSLKHLSFLLYLMECSCLALNSLSEVHRQKKTQVPRHYLPPLSQITQQNHNCLCFYSRREKHQVK